MGGTASKSAVKTGSACKDCGKTTPIPDARYCTQCGCEINLKNDPPWIKKKGD